MFVWLGYAAGCATAVAAEPADHENTAQEYSGAVRPVLETHCFGCHGYGGAEGGVSLDAIGVIAGASNGPSAEEGDSNHGGPAFDPAALVADRDVWLAVWRNLRAHTMPPATEERPTEDETSAVLGWIESRVLRLDPDHPDPGRPVLRRLNRREYRYTVQDLTGVDYDTEEAFPVDDTGYGFDTVGEALAVSPLLVEKMHDAAAEVSQRVIDREFRWGEGAPADRRVTAADPPPTDPAALRRYADPPLRAFASRAFRRPVDDQTVAELVELTVADATDGASLRDGWRRAVTMVLASPRFFFRVEPLPPAAGEARAALARSSEEQAHASSAPLDPWSLATRLSYFLWSTAPDDQLAALAASGELSDRVHEEVERMLADPRAERFIDAFVGQWLGTRNGRDMNINAYEVFRGAPPELLERFDWRVRDAMQEETELLFAHLLREDRDATELLTARYSFLNEPLARFYGVPGVEGDQMRRVELPESSGRVGLLTHGSFLTATSNPTRTSPVKRGLFVLDNLLGAPPPPPPPDVPALEAARGALGPEATARQVMEAHRKEPLCASCHKRMDPIGLALEGFNAAGARRADFDPTPIDTSGELVSGEKFDGPAELAELIATQKRADYLRCLVEKMMTFAVGRGVEYFDAPTIDRVVDSLLQDGAGVRRVVHLVVETPAFRRTRR